MTNDTKKEPIDMSRAKEIIAGSIATVEQMLQSSLVPPDQKAALTLMRAQLLGAYAMVEIRNHFIDSPIGFSG